MNFLMMRLKCIKMNAQLERLFVQGSLGLVSRASVLGDISKAWKLLDMNVFDEVLVVYKSSVVLHILLSGYPVTVIEIGIGL
jgi:hypothetical protein